MHFLVFLSALVACAAGVPLNSTSSKVEGRILGGSLTFIRRVPYQVSLHANGRYICGGAIISLYWVITAKTCVRTGSLSSADTSNNPSWQYELYQPADITVSSGSSFSSCFGKRHEAEMIIPYDTLTHELPDYNIALVRVRSNFVFSSHVKAIPLQDTEVPAGIEATVSGWGKSRDIIFHFQRRRPGNRFLRSMTVKIVSDPCNTVHTEYICASTFNGSSAVCQGDYGGPLVVNGTLVGILYQAEWADDVACSKRGLYAKISAIRNWIGRYVV